MSGIKREKCRHCNHLFVSDHRNKSRQRYCKKPECRKASKADSQKPENIDYFRGPDNVERTQIKMTSMYHWLSRRIEAHVKICVLALMIERIAERSCDLPWSKIRPALEKLQATKLFNLKYRVCLRDEISADTHNILNK